MDSGRLEAFSDNVFGVAITLLALSLAISGPGLHQPTLASKLAGHWPAYAAYAVSFATIGIIWVNHHTLFKNISEIDRTLLFINLLLLFFVVSIPFATSTISAYLRAGGGNASLAAAIYQGVFEGMSITFTLLVWRAIRREHLQVALTPKLARQATIRFGIGNVVYVAGIGIAFVSAPASLALSGLVAGYYIFEQTPPVRAQLLPGQSEPAADAETHERARSQQWNESGAKGSSGTDGSAGQHMRLEGLEPPADAGTQHLAGRGGRGRSQTLRDRHHDSHL